MQSDCYKKRADEAKGKSKPGGGGREGGHGGGPQSDAALAYTASTGNVGSSEAHGSTHGLSTWVLHSGAINHMATGDKGFTDRTVGRGAEVVLTNGEKVPIKGHCHVFMDVFKGSTKTHIVLGEPMLFPDLASNLLLVREVDRNRCAVVFVDSACYILSDGDAVRSSGVLDKASVVGKVNDLTQYVLKVKPVKASAIAASTRIAW